jgi:hypothetical protein
MAGKQRLLPNRFWLILNSSKGVNREGIPPFSHGGLGVLRNQLVIPLNHPLKKGGLKTPVAHLKIVKKAFLPLQRGF